LERDEGRKRERERKGGRGKKRGIAHATTRHKIGMDYSNSGRKRSVRERGRTKACFRNKERGREREREIERTVTQTLQQRTAHTQHKRHKPVKRNINTQRDCICTRQQENNIDKTVVFEGMEGGGARGESTFGKSVYDRKHHALKGNSQTFSWTRYELHVNTNFQC